MFLGFQAFFCRRWVLRCGGTSAVLRYYLQADVTGLLEGLKAFLEILLRDSGSGFGSHCGDVGRMVVMVVDGWLFKEEFEMLEVNVCDNASPNFKPILT